MKWMFLDCREIVRTHKRKRIEEKIHMMIAMIHFRSVFFLTLCVTCWSCGSDDSEFDCSGSDLSFQVDSSVAAVCGLPSGVIRLKPMGGAGQISYSLDGATFQVENTFSGLTSGSYTATVMDGNGCTFSGSVIVASENSDLTLVSISQSESGCGTSNGTVVLGADGGEMPYRYRADGGEYLEAPEVVGLESGVHLMQVQDAIGCVSSLEVLVFSGVSLSEQVMPIINLNCAVEGCHGDTQAPLLTSKGAVMAHADRIRDQTVSGAMPVGDMLSDSDIALISCWVNDGAKNN